MLCFKSFNIFINKILLSLLILKTTDIIRISIRINQAIMQVIKLLKANLKINVI